MTRERYEPISLHDLREIAKNRGMRRISTLKKADLIDAMLKRDEEEAIILRQERIQRRQQQEASQNAENEGKNVRRPAADTAAAAAGPSREEETAAGNSPEAAGRYGDERASEQDKSGSRQGQNERTAQDSSPAGQNRPDGAGQERTVSAGEGGQSRQRGQGSARGRQVPAPTIPAIRRVGARQAAPEGTTVRTSRTAGSPDRPGRIRLVRIKTGRRIPQEEGFALRIRDRKETAGGPIIRTRDVFPRRQLTRADPAGLQASGMAAENSIVMRARRAHRKRL